MAPSLLVFIYWRKYFYSLRRSSHSNLRLRCANSAGRARPAGNPSAPTHPHFTQSATTFSNMNTLEHLGIIKSKENIDEDTSLYQHILTNIRTNDYNKSVLTHSLVIELYALVTQLRSRHDVLPPDKISRHQFCHILAFLVCRMHADNVSDKLEKALKRRIPKDIGTHLWQPGIDIILKAKGDDGGQAQDGKLVCKDATIDIPQTSESGTSILNLLLKMNISMKNYRRRRGLSWRRSWCQWWWWRRGNRRRG